MTLPQIDINDIDIVFILDWYDGPVSGHAWYKDQYCYFEIEDINSDWDNDKSWYTQFNLYPLSGQSLIMALANRRLIEDIVGYYWNPVYSADGKPIHGTRPTKKCYNHQSISSNKILEPIWNYRFDKSEPPIGYFRT